MICVLLKNSLTEGTYCCVKNNVLHLFKQFLHLIFINFPQLGKIYENYITVKISSCAFKKYILLSRKIL